MPARIPGLRRLADLPWPERARTRHRRPAVAECRSGGSRRAGRCRGPTRLADPGRLVGDDQGCLRLLGVAAERGRGGPGVGDDGSSSGQRPELSARGHLVPAPGASAPRCACRISAGASRSCPGIAGPHPDAASTRPPTATSPGPSMLSGRCSPAFRSSASCRRRSLPVPTIRSRRPTSRRWQAARDWGRREGVPLLDLDALAAPYFARRAHNPDGLHWSWELHREVGESLAGVLARI